MMVYRLAIPVHFTEPGLFFTYLLEKQFSPGKNLRRLADNTVFNGRDRNKDTGFETTATKYGATKKT